MICASTIGAQIVNVEKKRTPTDSTWVGSIELSFAGSKTTKSTVSIFSGGTLQYKPKNEKDFWLFDTKYSLVSVDGEVFCEEGIITSNVLAAALTNNDIAWLNSLSAEQFDAEAFSG